jgi:hypothetical protein
VRAGEAVLTLLEKDIKPSDIMTMQAFENAITVIITLGGRLHARNRYFYLLRWRLVHWSLVNSCPRLRLRMPSY